MSNTGKIDRKVVDINDAASSDPLDLARLRVSAEMMEGAAVKRLLTTVPVRKPNKQDFVRVRPEPQFRDTLALIELKDERETFVIDLNAVPELREECYFATCFTAITRTGTLFLWPVKLSIDGRANDWHLSAATAAQHAMKHWVRIRADMSAGSYVLFEAAGANIPEPEWPDDLPFDAIIRLAFKDKVVRSLDHPVVKRLRCE